MSGEWGFASGSAYAGWLVCGALVTRGGEVVAAPRGPQMVMLFVPRSAVELLDTWRSVGLRGSGSGHFRVSQVFVSREYAVAGEEMGRVPPAGPARVFPVSYFDFGALAMAAVAVGVAQEALDAVKALMAAKTPALASGVLASSPVAQERLGRAESLVYSSRLMLREAAAQAVGSAGGGGEALTSLVWLTGAAVAENTVAAVDLAYNLAGSSSVYESCRLERCFRDIHTAGKHITVSSSLFEAVGHYLLGGPLRMRR